MKASICGVQSVWWTLGVVKRQGLLPTWRERGKSRFIVGVAFVTGDEVARIDVSGLSHFQTPPAHLNTFQCHQQTERNVIRVDMGISGSSSSPVAVVTHIALSSNICPDRGVPLCLARFAWSHFDLGQAISTLPSKMALNEPGGYTRRYHSCHTGWIQLIPVIFTPYNAENQYICFLLQIDYPPSSVPSTW